MSPVFLLSVAVVLLIIGALMAAIVAAFSVTSRTDLVDMADGGRNASALSAIAADAAAHANAVNFFRVLVETSAVVLVTVAVTVLVDNIWWAMGISAVVLTVALYVLVGASPRSVGQQHAKGLLRGSAPVIRGARVVLGPLAGGLSLVGTRLTPGIRTSSSFASEEQLLSIIDDAAENALIEEDDRELIHSVFEFTETIVREVMVPRTDMVSVDAGTSTREAMGIFLDKGVSRVPVVDDDADDVVGVLYLKDLVQFGFSDEPGWRGAAIDLIVRPAVFVPESMKVETLLQQMKREAVHVCVVIDEYGGVSGLVTLEDLIEELVGEIADEYDPRADEVAEVSPGRYRLSSRLGLDEVGELFGIELDDEDVDSIGGLLGKALGRIPHPGATAQAEGLIMTGGPSLGRGRGIASVFVEAAPRVDAATGDTGEHPVISRSGEEKSHRRGERT